MGRHRLFDAKRNDRMYNTIDHDQMTWHNIALRKTQWHSSGFIAGVTLYVYRFHETTLQSLPDSQ